MQDRDSTPSLPADQSRRRFCQVLSAAAGAATLANMLPQSAQAAELPRLAESDPLAANMGYKEDTAKVDHKKHANHKIDQTCANCQFYQGGKEGYGPCQLFPGKSVSAKGWCQVWAKKSA